MIATLPAAVLDTILTRLAILFIAGAGGDQAAARQAALHMLATYQPDNEQELRLAAEIVSFSFHALEALGQAALPDISLNHKLRLRGSAVSLSRASHKAQRQLDQVQKQRRTGSPQPSIEPPKPQPKLEQAISLIETTRDTIEVASTTGQTWTQAYQQRQRAKRLARNLSRNQSAPVPPTAPVTMHQPSLSGA